MAYWHWKANLSTRGSSGRCAGILQPQVAVLHRARQPGRATVPSPQSSRGLFNGANFFHGAPVVLLQPGGHFSFRASREKPAATAAMIREAVSRRDPSAQAAHRSVKDR